MDRLCCPSKQIGSLNICFFYAKMSEKHTVMLSKEYMLCSPLRTVLLSISDNWANTCIFLVCLFVVVVFFFFFFFWRVAKLVRELFYRIVLSRKFYLPI